MTGRAPDLAFTFTLTFALALGGCATERTLLAVGPPPPQDEVRTSKPRAHVFWRSGRWVWSEARGFYYWEAGAWEGERDEQLWIPGHWLHVEEDGRAGWAWVEPRWEAIPRPTRDVR